MAFHGNKSPSRWPQSYLRRLHGLILSTFAIGFLLDHRTVLSALELTVEENG
jgi:hypothetical protein